MMRSRSRSTPTTAKSGSLCAISSRTRTRFKTHISFCKERRLSSRWQIFASRLTAQLLVGSAFASVRTYIDIPPNLVIGSPRSFGDGASWVKRSRLSRISASDIFHFAGFMRSHLRTIQLRRVCWKRRASSSKDVSRTMSSKTESFSIRYSTPERSNGLSSVVPASLSRAMAVHHAHLTVHLMVALRFAKDGIRVRLRRLFCVCAAREQRPRCDENYKRPAKHPCCLVFVDEWVKFTPEVALVAALCRRKVSLTHRCAQRLSCRVPWKHRTVFRWLKRAV